MKLHTAALAGLAFLGCLTLSAPAVLAGAQDTGDLASCEIPAAKGIPIFGTAAVNIDPETQLVQVGFQMLSIDSGVRIEVVRALTGTGLFSPMEIVCDVLHTATAEGGPTVAEQILANLRLSGRTIKITKRGVFGCDELPCARPGKHPDVASIPGTGLLSALGDVILYAVRP